ncbi:MAG: tetratricopeptide repeat protein [Verrucomicrobiota bacterium]|nr:tetratricopeptide repeat protein [Verrucomicrobiota bacterium]
MSAGAIRAAEPPLPAVEREAIETEFTRKRDSLAAAIAREPEKVALYSQRGDCHLFLGQFREAVADFEKMIALDPAQDAPHWRLGIAYYFAGDFEKSARQFTKYHRHDDRDRENGLWKFLAQAASEGVEAARRDMLPYTRFDREPFPALYALYGGTKTPDQVFSEIEAKGLTNQRPVHFFAHYYVGLLEGLQGRKDAALEHLRRALTEVKADDPTGSRSYMWQVARLHYDWLRERGGGAAQTEKR